MARVADHRLAPGALLKTQVGPAGRVLDLDVRLPARSAQETAGAAHAAGRCPAALGAGLAVRQVIGASAGIQEGIAAAGIAVRRAHGAVGGAAVARPAGDLRMGGADNLDKLYPGAVLANGHARILGVLPAQRVMARGHVHADFLVRPLQRCPPDRDVPVHLQLETIKAPFSIDGVAKYHKTIANPVSGECQARDDVVEGPVVAGVHKAARGVRDPGGAAELAATALRGVGRPRRWRGRGPGRREADRRGRHVNGDILASQGCHQHLSILCRDSEERCKLAAVVMVCRVSANAAAPGVREQQHGPDASLCCTRSLVLGAAAARSDKEPHWCQSAGQQQPCSARARTAVTGCQLELTHQRCSMPRLVIPRRRNYLICTLDG
mmetsp:Transcript_38004/g.108575  ORF Transcript_38004/g.108575 Transcript_38004/m.108575 type:complete len:380 (-) Transcript_38004:327-1466(-)